MKWNLWNDFKVTILFLLAGILIVVSVFMVVEKEEPKGQDFALDLSAEAVLTPANSLFFFGTIENEAVLTIMFNKDGKLEVEGDMTEGAKLFFEYILKHIVDDYIKRKLEEGR